MSEVASNRNSELWVAYYDAEMLYEFGRRRKHKVLCDTNSISELINLVVQKKLFEYRVMQKIPDVAGLEHELAADALQRWLWGCIAAGWDPTLKDNPQWSHDDNIEAQSLGWMIAQPPGSKHLDLFSLRRLSPYQTMQHIVSMAPVSPLCAKAVMVLSAQRLEHPNIKFNFSSTKHMV